VTALGGDTRFRDDDGSADPAAAAALAAFSAGTGSEHAALTALASARLLVPVLAAASDGERASEMSVPTLIGHDGRPAILAFTCVGTLARWRQEARPVPAGADQVWAAAVADSCAVVVDVAGPVPLAVDGARLAALAGGQPVPLPFRDPEVQAAVQAATAAEPAIAGAVIGPGDDGSDLAIRVTLAAGCDRAAGDAAVRALGDALMTGLGGRLRRGIAISAAPAAHKGR
jgi:hypothetical protein